MALVYLKRKVGHIIKSESFKLGNFYFELEILYVVGKMVISNFNVYFQFELVFGIRIIQTIMKIPNLKLFIFKIFRTKFSNYVSYDFIIHII